MESKFLFYYVGKGDYDSVKDICDQGIDVNIKDGDGNTPLMWSIHFDRLDLVKLFIAYGGKTNIKNKYGTTVLKLASEESKIIYRYLIELDLEENNV